MASREEMILLRSARAGDARAQVALARRYLFGGAGLPRNAASSLLWLERAARQGEPDAWKLIGRHIPFEVASSAPDRHSLCQWYERAFDDGQIDAGLILARLVLSVEDTRHGASLRCKAWQALECAAEHDIPEAQWLLAQLLEKKEADCDAPAEGKRDLPCLRHLEWARRAAENGVMQARRVLAHHAWRTRDEQTFLYWARPLADSLVSASSRAEAAAQRLSNEEIVLLSRCVRALFRTGASSEMEFEKYAEVAAHAGDKQAQFYLGLWIAKLDEEGERIEGLGRLVNYRKAVHWLTQAGLQGMAAAWHVASRIYLNVEFAYRSIAEAEKYLALAAEGGHRRAQLELARRLWRKRADIAGNDVRALYWLQKAAAQGCRDAASMLEKCARVAAPAPWAQKALMNAAPLADPLTVARLKVAACFGLTDREALLLDLIAADHGHCLEVDIRGLKVRGKRRLILIQTAEERRILDRAKSAFEGIERGPAGPEGNVQQRLYRLRRMLQRMPEADPASEPRPTCTRRKIHGIPVVQGNTGVPTGYRPRTGARA